MPPTAPPTLRDVARAAGLAPSTVSHALRNTGSVAQETCERVQALAKKMGYRANPLLAAIGSRKFRQGRGALLTPIASIGSSAHGDAADVVYDPRVLARAEEMGFRMEVHDLAASADPAMLGRQLYHRGVAGILLGNLYGWTELPPLPWADFAVVSRGRQPFETPFPFVAYELFGAIHALWNGLRELGYRRIGWAILRHTPEHPDDRARHAACLWCQEQTAARDRVPIFREPMVQGEAPEAELLKWVRERRPDVVVGFHSRIVATLRAGGWAVPGRIGFASLHVREVPEDSDIAGILHDLGRVQLRAIELLNLQIRHHQRGPQDEPTQLLLPARWRVGDTVRSQR